MGASSRQNDRLIEPDLFAGLPLLCAAVQNDGNGAIRRDPNDRASHYT